MWAFFFPQQICTPLLHNSLWLNLWIQGADYKVICGFLTAGSGSAASVTHYSRVIYTVKIHSIALIIYIVKILNENKTKAPTNRHVETDQCNPCRIGMRLSLLQTAVAKGLRGDGAPPAASAGELCADLWSRVVI